MDVYYAPPRSIRAGSIPLDGEEFHHCVRVARHRPGDEVFIADGEGTMYRCSLDEAGEDGAVCRILDRIPGRGEHPGEITLVAAPLKAPARTDWMIEKATELGMRRFIPLRTRRTIARAEKTERWIGIALAAMKQCGRCRLPEIAPAIGYGEALDAPSSGCLVLFHESAGDRLTAELARTLGRTPRGVSILIGPEGGFDDGEVDAARSRGALVLSLGRRRLRSETAAIAALALFTSEE